MFNAEKLLGQVLGGVLGKRGEKGKNSSLMGGLTSGAGLMTAIGLAVGAYEVLKDKNTGGQDPGQEIHRASYASSTPWGKVNGQLECRPLLQFSVRVPR